MSDGYIPFAERIGGDESAIAGAVSPDFLNGTGSGNNGDSGGPGSGGGTDSGPSATEQFDPAIHVSRDKRNADGSYTKRRGRRSGPSASSQRGPKANSQASVESLTRILTVLHIGIASATKTPEMLLQDDEAKALSAATADVLQQFDIRPDPRIEAVVGLCVVAGGIYGPRIYMIRERHKEEAQNKRNNMSVVEQ